jgi:hypothetical protein
MQSRHALEPVPRKAVVVETLRVDAAYPVVADELCARISATCLRPSHGAELVDKGHVNARDRLAMQVL